MASLIDDRVVNPEMLGMRSDLACRAVKNMDEEQLLGFKPTYSAGYAPNASAAKPTFSLEISQCVLVKLRR